MDKEGSIKIPLNTLKQLRGTLIRVLSRENLSAVDKLMLRKSQSMSSFQHPDTYNYRYSANHRGMI